MAVRRADPRTSEPLARGVDARRRPCPWAGGAARARALRRCRRRPGADLPRRRASRRGGRIAPGDAVVALELLPSAGMVRVVTPTSPRELAVELYGDPQVGMQVLGAYNREVVSEVGDEGWIRAGTESRSTPACSPAATARSSRRRGCCGSARTGRTWRRQHPRRGGHGHGGALLLVPSRPCRTMHRASRARVLSRSARSRVLYMWVDWWVENDPAAVARGLVPEREYPRDRPAALGVEDLGGEKSRLLAHVDGAGQPHRPLRRRRPCGRIGRPAGDRAAARRNRSGAPARSAGGVARRGHRDRMAARRGPRRLLTLGEPGSFAEEAWRREQQERLGLPPWPAEADPGATEEEGQKPLLLEGDPRALLESLREQRRVLPEGDLRDDVEQQIAELEKTIEQTGDTGLRRIEARYVAGEERATAIQLQLYVAFDPESDWPMALALWDYTLPGPPRVYRGAATTPRGRSTRCSRSSRTTRPTRRETSGSRSDRGRWRATSASARRRSPCAPTEVGSSTTSCGGSRWRVGRRPRLPANRDSCADRLGRGRRPGRRNEHLRPPRARGLRVGPRDGPRPPRRRRRGNGRRRGRCKHLRSRRPDECR